MEPIFPDRMIFAHLPTPIERVERLSSSLGGAEILIKRDDQTGLALGGNKTRKLEFLCADALAQKCDYLITTGANQSNHCRQTAAAAAHLGLGCSLVLSGVQPDVIQGNLLLDQMMGANLHWTGDRSAKEVMAEVGELLRSAGHNPYLIPLGGSNALGVVGYVWAMQELKKQLVEYHLAPDLIVFASASGGTQAGAVLGKKIFNVPGKILGISISYPSDNLKKKVAALATETAILLGLNNFNVNELIHIDDSYLGQGYGVVGDLEREAIQLLARLEGILLDPVYTGRAMGGLIQQIRQGQRPAGKKILFWHTGGAPSLFAYGDQLL